MKSEHINIKLNERYIKKLQKIANTLGIKDISGTYGGYPLLFRFCITIAEKTLSDMYKIIPTLHPTDLNILLQSIRTKKTLEYHKERQQNQDKTPKKIIPEENKVLSKGITKDM